MIESELTDALDMALGELQSGEQLPDVLGHGAAAQPELAELLRAAAALEPLRAVEMPTPERRADDRNRFLAELTREARRPVPAGRLVRIREWFAHLFAWQAAAGPALRREPKRMNALVLKFVLVVAMLFGSAGGTAAAAAHSLPGSPLYPAKLAMEQARLQVAADPSDQAQLHVILARLRVQEMVQLVLAGREPGEAAIQQLQQHLDAALRLAARMPEEAMQGALTRWQQQIQQEEQALQETQLRAGEPAQEPLRQALQILQQTQQQLQAGQQNGQAFRWQHGLGLDPDDVIDAAAGDCQDCEPVGDEFHYRRGPEAGQPGSGEPGGSQYRSCVNCEPEGDAQRVGPQPETPAGPGTCDGCEPAGDEYRYGQDADRPQPGPGQPGGPETQPCDDCEPDGDQHQYGPGEPSGPETPPCDDCEPDGNQHQHGEPAAEPGPADDPGTGDKGGMGDPGSGGEPGGSGGGGMGDSGGGGGMGDSGSGGQTGDSGGGGGMGDSSGGGRSR